MMDLQRELGLAYLFISHDLRGGRAHQPPHRGDVSRPYRRIRRQARLCSRSRCIPIPRRCCWPCRCRIPRLKRQQASCCRATCRARSIRPPAAHFHTRCPYVEPLPRRNAAPARGCSGPLRLLSSSRTRVANSSVAAPAIAQHPRKPLARWRRSDDRPSQAIFLTGCPRIAVPTQADVTPNKTVGKARERARMADTIPARRRCRHAGKAAPAPAWIPR